MAADYQHTKILVIDDDRDILQLVSAILKKHGYNPITASDGDQGLTLFESENPAIVLTDINMPGISGTAKN